MAQTSLQSCVAACRDCIDACETCIGQELGNAQMAECLRLCLDCIEICPRLRHGHAAQLSLSSEMVRVLR